MGASSFSPTMFVALVLRAMIRRLFLFSGGSDVSGTGAFLFEDFVVDGSVASPNETNLS